MKKIMMMMNFMILMIVSCSDFFLIAAGFKMTTRDQSYKSSQKPWQFLVVTPKPFSGSGIFETKIFNGKPLNTEI